MEPRAHLVSKWMRWLAICLLTIAISSCGNKDAKEKSLSIVKDYSIDETLIPRDTILANDKRLSISNGMYRLANKNYSGIVKELYPRGSVKSYRSILQGMLYGQYKSFYESGNAFEVRQYRNNLSTGKQIGYWEDGTHLKFEYNYYEEKREGVQKKWYRNGQTYLFSTYANDREEGLQQGWRENGKLFLNYVAKNGYTYGLQQTALCYTLLNEKLKSQK